MKKEIIYRTFSRIPELSTPRLTLRKMLVSDAQNMFEYASQKEVTKFLTWNPHPNSQFTKEYLEYIGKRYAAGMFYDWAIVLKSNHKMIGTCGFTSFDTVSDVGEVGYVLNPAYWGKGLAKEALNEVIRFGFEELHLHRIEARFIEGNLPSLYLMKSVGMQLEGYHRESLKVRGAFVTFGICSILHSEWNDGK